MEKLAIKHDKTESLPCEELKESNLFSFQLLFLWVFFKIVQLLLMLTCKIDTH